MSKSSDLTKTVRAYVCECVINNNDSEIELKTEKDCARYIKEKFAGEYQWRVAQAGPQTAMIDWLQGLSLPIDFENFRILQLAVKWGSIPENATESQEDKILEKYWQFMAVKILSMIRTA